MEKIEVKLTYTKSTKGTHVYTDSEGAEVADVPIPSLYIRRGFIPNTPPKTITVTIEENND